MKESSIQPKIQEILIKNKDYDQEADSCEVFVYQPENIEEMKLGNLFVVGKINSAPEATHIINLLTSIIKREYYANRKRKPLSAMEESLKKANGALLELAKKENSPWINKINFIAAILIKDQLHFTALGQTKVFLLRGGRLTDLSKKLVPSQEKINPKKPFQSIASGKLFLGDTIISTTADIFNIIPQKGLKQILELGQIDQLQNIIQENKNFSAQGLVIIDIIPETEIIERKPAIIFSQPSPLTKQLVAKENQPSLSREKIENALSIFNLFFRNYFFKLKDYWRFRIKSQPIKSYIPFSQNQPNQTSETIDKPSLPTTKRLYKELNIQKSKKENFLFNFIKKSFTFNQEILLALAGHIKNSLSEFKKNPPQHRKIYLATLAIIFMSAIGIRYTLAYQYKKEVAFNENLVKQSEEKLNQLHKIFFLEFPASELDIPANNFNFLPKQISISQNKLLITSRESDVFYSLAIGENLKSGNFIPTDLPKDKNWLRTTASKNDLLLFSPENELYKYNFSSKTSSLLPISLPTETEIKDMVIFNNNLYLLDAKNSRLFKCPDLNNCQPWLNESKDLSNSSSISVDGALYILKQNSEVSKYFGGIEKELWQLKIKPLSNSFAKIQTEQNFQNIYLFDNHEKRIVILNKNGELVKQYYFNISDDIKDFQVSDDEKNIFILTENKIFQFNN